MNILDYLKSKLAPEAPIANDWPTQAPIQSKSRVVHRPSKTPNVDVDKIARGRGFKNAALMDAFYQRQREQEPGSTSSGSQRGLLERAVPMHPKFLIDNLLKRWGEAEKKQGR